MKTHPSYIQDLLVRIGEENDVTAYEKLYYSFHKSLYNFACSLNSCPQKAEEIVSDVFIKIWLLRKQLPQVNNINIYLYTCVRNRAVDYANKERKYRIVNLSPNDWNDILIELRNPSDYSISSDLLKKINQSINQLPPQCKVIFRLVKEDGLSYKQVAKIMQISPFTVRNQVAIAVKKMGEALPQYIIERSGTNGQEKA